MIIGEGPGREELRTGRPFVGQTGKELRRYLWDACHVNVDEVRLTNLFKTDEEPSEAGAAKAWPELEEEIFQVRARVIVTLGRWATRALLPDSDMDTVHGIPFFTGDMFNTEAVLPVFHPAAGMYDTEIQAKIAYDFQQLNLLLKGKIEPRSGMEDQYPDTHYGEILNPVTCIDEIVAVDTEGYLNDPWMLTMSVKSGDALMSRSAVGFQGRVVLHNSMHDLGVLRAMGVELGDDQFDDTMIMAYLLCVEPQGLKELAYRLCGMRMDSFSEITAPDNQVLAVEWLLKAAEWLTTR
jgi:DNA polymerase